MGKLNIFLLILMILCAMLVVEQQHKARTLFVALGKERQAEQQIAVAFTHLQLQQATLAQGARVDRVARMKLGMSPPAPGAVVFMALDGGFPHE